MAAKRSRQEAIIGEVAGVIDLCSPEPCKPCRKSTPLHQAANSNREDVDEEPFISVSLFGSDRAETTILPGLQIVAPDSEDEYWEPEGYRAISQPWERVSVALPRSPSSRSELSPQSPIADENSAPTNCVEAVIDLCSPACSSRGASRTPSVASSSEPAVPVVHQSRDHEPLAKPAHGPIDLTQASDEGSDEHEDTTQHDTVHSSHSLTHIAASSGESQSSVSLFSRIAAAPRLQSNNTSSGTNPARPRTTSALMQLLHGDRPPVPPPLPLAVSATSTKLQSAGGATVTTTSTTATTGISTNTQAAAQRTASVPKQKAAAKRTISTAAVSVSATATAEGGLARAGTAPTGRKATSSSSSAPSSSTAAISAPIAAPLESAFRSRFAEKTLVTLPALRPGDSWEVMLLIDKRERSNAHIQSKMAANCIPCRLATLAVGDFLWVVRPRAGNQGTSTVASSSSSSSGAGAGAAVIQGFCTGEDEQQQEDTQTSAAVAPEDDEEDRAFDTSNVFVLDCVAERKSVNDLVSSFSDGRYMEQKSRLKACNLRTTMYIVEGDASSVTQHQKAITTAHIKTTMVSIHVDNGMHVLRTRSMDHTITCLQNLHRQVEKRFQRTLNSGTTHQPYAEFQAMYSKKCASTYRQLFGHQLRQVHGVSTTVAVTLMNRYGTTARFMDELGAMGQAKAEYTLANMVNEVTQRKLGPKLAQRLCQIYLSEF